MPIPDMPSVPPQNVPVMVVQANQGQGGDTRGRMIGICAPVPNHNYSLENVIEPIMEAHTYFAAYEHRTVSGKPIIAVLQQPKHGVLRPVVQADVGTILPGSGDPVDPAAGLYFYLPQLGYDGKDNATIQVDFGGGLQVKVKYYFQGVIGLGSNWEETYCKKTGTEWKISSTLNANGNSTITSVEYQAPLASADTSALNNPRKAHR